MKKKYSLSILTALVILIPLITLVAQAAVGDPNFGNVLFQNRWIEQDRLVGVPGVTRPYTWGPSVPEAPNAMYESYVESPGGQRQVQYFDKARMEINNPSNGLVTAGLAVKELVSGQRQDGDNKFTSLTPSKTQVAGDAVSVNPNAPVYASFKDVVTLGNADAKSKPNAVGTTINQSIDKSGTVGTVTPPETVTIGAYDSQTGHNIAKPFQDFENLTGPITDPISGQRRENQPIYTTQPTSNVFGLAISEPYWVSTKVGGVDRTVLVQLFERRVLTYNPALSGTSQVQKVEMGNLGQHYYQWRYVESTTTTPTPTPTQPAATVPADYSQYLANYHKAGGGIPVGNSSGSGNVVSYSTGGAIYSSPLIDLSKNLAVIGTDTKGLHGIDVSSSTVLSNKFIFQPSGNPSFAGNVPLLYNGTIYIGASNGIVYAINETSSGVSVTEKDKTTAVTGAIKGSVALSPDGSRLYYVAGSSLYAVDTATLSTQRWVQAVGTNLTAPVVDGSGNIYVGGADGKLYAYKSDGTALNSSYPVTIDAASAINSQPALAGGAIYVATSTGKITKLSPSNGVSFWSITVSPTANIATTLAVYGGAVYAGTDGGRVFRYNDSNGTLASNFSTPASSAVQSSIAVVDNFYYFGDNGGRVWRVDINSADNNVQLLSGAGVFGTNSPVVAGGKVFIGSNSGNFYVIK